MRKKQLILTLVVTLLFCSTSFSFATENDVLNNSAFDGIVNSEFEEPGIDTQDNKHRIVKEYIKTTSGTQYNDSKTRKCEWTEKHYKVYQENIGTGNRVFKYNEYKWSWKGYKKVSGSWEYVKTKSGTTRSQTNASDIYSFLTSF